MEFSHCLSNGEKSKVTINAKLIKVIIKYHKNKEVQEDFILLVK